MADSQFKPSGPVRSGTIYISWRLGKALNLLASSMEKTREELTDAILEGWLKHNHPNVIEWVDQRDAAEKDFQKTLALEAAKEKTEKFQATTTDQLV